ncbi:MAG: carbon monoxide dehydrogenase maturation protein [Actinobacteria bacterium]|nr:carbon monoxide dehydrogenase maturation protein [Actinomycetota bacterium]
MTRYRPPHGGLVAVAGKGGTGKTTFSSLLIRYLVEQGETPVLAVDADPNANLGELLGLRPSVSVGALREKSFAGEAALRDIPPGWDKRTWTEYRMHQAVAEGPGFDVLEMGRPEGPGCYCFANSLLREHVNTLAGSYRWVVMDNEAGLEHLNRHVCRRADVMFLLSDPSPRGLRTAERIRELIRELKLDVGQVVLVMNGLRPGAGEAGWDHTAFHFLPWDDEVMSADAEGRSVFSLAADNAMLLAVGRLVDDYVVGVAQERGRCAR